MFITFLEFSDNKTAASEFMAAHNDWIAQGFAEGKFLCVGSLSPAAGGAIISHGESRDELEARVATDPFVVHGVVSAEIREIDAKRTIPALNFLKEPA
ncbi:YciI family protein [Paracoccus xiamenensis]|uniref:YciI family protein n=1 Tax=Paracoccus xiamenensis TaxID=2714901 RepID=UPI00140816FA|nr:YciI family protein [Paracoccus xiamenensis]NHF72575.1 hypothetical protein [Paracoccus xiamenensis]